jgi:RHH-type rel operon transcriptional repressor/antitoxin RelB
MISFRLPAPLEDRLAQLATLTQRSKSFFIKEALERHLDEMEDTYVALNRISQPKRSFHSTTDVLNTLKSKNKRPARSKKKP